MPPRTPQEMADWLEQTFGDELWPSDEDTFGAVIAYLRAVPTDAQKMEALRWATAAGVHGRSAMEMAFAEDDMAYHDARDAALGVRKALRLLGLPTE